MTPRQRLHATLRGQPVDRPAVNFYEIGGFDVDPDDDDAFNVYHDPSWRPLLDLAETQTDLIRLRGPRSRPQPGHPRHELFQSRTWLEDGRRFTRTTLTVAGRTMTELVRRDPDMDTTWTLEPLLKDADDLGTYLQIPDEALRAGPVDVSYLEQSEREVGERGIVMVDTGDPLCAAASLFSMENYTILAMTEPALFGRLLDKLAPPLYARVAEASRAFPGRLWRIYGPEYATEPYLPPRLFEEYVVRYTEPMVRAIQAHGGYARIHSHGRLKAVLPLIAKMGADGLDPIEPPPHGDVTLAEVRRDYGRDWVLFGNIEIRDIENAPPAEFERIVATALAEGTAGAGRGFVLMPTACPCGRTITPTAMTNYRTMVRLAHEFGA